MKRILLCVLLVIPIAGLLVGGKGLAGGDKGAPWKPFLPADAYKELTSRSITLIAETAGSDQKDAAERIEVEAAILAGYTMSVKNRSDDAVAALRGAARQAAQAALAKDVKKLSAFAKMIASAPKAAAEQDRGKSSEHALANLMEIFRGKTKGGEGLHADLQYHPKLKNLNGIEALLGALGAKKLSEDNLAKVAKELPNLGYRVAVVGVLTHEFAPAKDQDKWQGLSTQMRDAAIALAEAAQQKNGDGVLKAAQALENSCTQCHRDFKKK